jgi:hypothetical protein
MADSNTAPSGEYMAGIALRVFRLICVALATPLAALAILAGSAFAGPARACAAPGWDIQAYDKCTDAAAVKGLKGQDWDAQNKNCCQSTGGNWNAIANKCQAPAMSGPLPPITHP